MDRPARWRCLRRLTAEPSLLLVAYAFGVSGIPFGDLLLKRICQTTPNIPYQWCDSLTDHPSAEAIVHPKAAILLMTSTLIEGVTPAIASWMAGAWSDRVGSRKPLIIMPLAGFAVKFALLAVIMSIPTLPVECFIATTLPVVLSGGWATYFGAVTSLAGDKTVGDERGRTLHLGMLNVVFLSGFVPGLLSSNVVLRALGHTGVLLFTSGVCFFALLIALCMVSEISATTNVNEVNDGAHLLKDVFLTFTKKRARCKRICLYLGLLSLVTGVMAADGESNLRYMFVRQELRWSVMDYSLYKSVQNGLHMVGIVIAFSILSQKLKIADAPLAIFSDLGAFVGSFLKAFASKSWMMYCGGSITMFHGAALPLMRSIISKSVDQNELAKVFTVITSLEALVPLIGQPLYTYVFRSTVNIFPGAFFLLSALIVLMDILICCIIHGIDVWYTRPEQEPLLRREDSTTSNQN